MTGHPSPLDTLRPLARPLEPLVVGLSVLGLLVLAGCGPTAAPARPARPAAADAHDHDHDHDAKPAAAKHDDHDDHDHAHPETLAAGVAELEKLWGGIKGALKGGKLDEADDKVHEVGHLLENLPELLAKTKPAADVAEAGKKAIDEVFACFETLDNALHAGEEEAKKIDVDGLTTRIESAFKSLSALVK